jgi:hypothetical protein
MALTIAALTLGIVGALRLDALGIFSLICFDRSDDYISRRASSLHRTQDG